MTVIEMQKFEAIRKRIPQLLKWVGNKQRYSEIIAEKIPMDFNNYIEPFVGTGAILGTIKPKQGIAGDILEPLIYLWKNVQQKPQEILQFYESSYKEYQTNRQGTYDKRKESYNEKPNPFDLLFISRSCYAGVMRFTKEGTISTPIGPHNLISPETFEKRLIQWHEAIQNTTFYAQDFEKTMALADEGDVIYCDPPYYYGQSILYGAQNFDFNRLWDSIEKCKNRGIRVLLSFDGKAKQGVEIREGLFEQFCNVDRGYCMLNRFKRKGLNMNGFELHDWLFLTW